MNLSIEAKDAICPQQFAYFGFCYSRKNVNKTSVSYEFNLSKYLFCSKYYVNLFKKYINLFKNYINTVKLNLAMAKFSSKITGIIQSLSVIWSREGNGGQSRVPGHECRWNQDCLQPLRTSSQKRRVKYNKLTFFLIDYL